MDLTTIAALAVLVTIAVAGTALTVYVVAVLVYDEVVTRHDGWRAYLRPSPPEARRPVVPTAQPRRLTAVPSTRPGAVGAARTEMHRTEHAAIAA